MRLSTTGYRIKIATNCDSRRITGAARPGPWSACRAVGALLRPPHVRRGDRQVLAAPTAGAVGGGGAGRGRPLGQRARAVRAAVRAAAARLRRRLLVQEQTEARLQVGRPRVTTHLQGRLQDAAGEPRAGAAGAAARLHRAQSAGDAGRRGGGRLRRPRVQRAPEEVAARQGVYSLPALRINSRSGVSDSIFLLVK